MNARGFTLLEVLIALAILAISLTVLLQTQAQSLSNAGRSRDITIATLLARSKLIDIERKLFHEGFVANTEEEDGNFREEGHEDYTWKYRVSDITLDMSALSSLCDSIGGGEGKDKKKSSSSGKSGSGNATDSNGPGGTGDCASLLGGLDGPMSSFTEELSRSMRTVELLVQWKEGDYKQHISIRALLTRDDFQTEQETDQNKAGDAANGALKAAGVPGIGQSGQTSGSGAVSK